MRLAAVVKGGFFGMAPEVVRLIAGLIEYQDGPVFDPCAGEGEALDVLGQSLGVPQEKLYAIELERDRSAKIRERLPQAQLLGPCSCFETRISAGTFAVAAVNAPFDSNTGGGRAEVDFLIRGTELLAPGGILVFVVPQHVVERYSCPAARFLWPNYEQLAVLQFPEEHRPYREVAVIGKKRRQRGDLAPTPEDWNTKHVVVGKMQECQLRWPAPNLHGVPKLFEKAGLTDDELVDALAGSPLWKLTEVAEAPRRARPPIPLALGHVALLLASGQLDGVIQPENDAPHLVRGSAHKVGLAPEVTTEETASGGIRTTTILKETIKLVVRTVDQEGTIRTFQ